MQNKKLIIFDFDGVLVNTNEIARRLHKEANPTLSDEYFDRMHDGNFMENLEKAMREDGYVVQPDWYELYAKGLEELTTEEFLKMLVLDLVAQYTLVIVSSMETKYIERQLAKENISQCFSEVLGSDVNPSKVVKIKNLLARRVIDPANVVFITDTVEDIREGRECGVKSIAVTWGMQDRKKLENEHPNAVVDTVPELEAAIEAFFLEPRN